MERDEEESTPEERVEYLHNHLIPIPNTSLGGPGFLDLREHQEDRERHEEGPKEVRLSNIAALLAPVLVLIIILIIIIYF